MDLNDKTKQTNPLNSKGLTGIKEITNAPKVSDLGQFKNNKKTLNDLLK